MVNEHESQNDDELAGLRPLVHAVHAEVPSDSQWDVARGRLMAALRQSSEDRAASAGKRSRGGASRRLGWFAIAAGVMVVGTLLLLQNEWPPAGKVVPAIDIGRIDVARAAYVSDAKGGRERLLSSEGVLRTGDRLRVAPDGGLQIRLEDGTRLWLAGGTEAVCGGPRSEHSPAWSLLQGEIQAEVTPLPQAEFHMVTPGAALRVLGTEFHVRVYPEQEPRKEKPTMRGSMGALGMAQQAVMVLTVLSGSVAVEAAGESQIVPEGTRVTVNPNWPSVTTEEVGQLDYLRKWVAQRMNVPTRPARAEVLRFVKRHPGLLQSLVAVDAETGKARHVTDFVGYPSIVQTFGPRLALVEASSVCYTAEEPVATGGSSVLVPYPRLMVDLEDGSKVAFPPMVGYRGGASELSPDRRKLAFGGVTVSADVDIEQSGLMLLDLETLKTTNLLPGDWKVGLTEPHWSPDSRWLAISKGTDDEGQKYKILLIDTLTGAVQSTELEGMYAHFTPDGKRLVYYGGYRDTGDWCPPGGELRVVTLPNGKPEPIFRLSADVGIGGLAFSPDGAFLALAEVRVGEAASKTPTRIHLIDLATKKDCVIPLSSCDASITSLRWLDDGSTVLFTWLARPPAADATVMRGLRTGLLNREGNQWKLSERQINLPALEESDGMKRFAGRLQEVFVAYHSALAAQYMHQLEESQREYAVARDRLASIMRDLKAGEGVGIEAVKLQPSDLMPYERFITEEASLSPAELSVQVVRGSLKWHIRGLLYIYWQKYGQFPPREEADSRQPDQSPKPPPSFAHWARQVGNDEWAFCHVPGRDQRGMRRHAFVVPGDDPDKIATSFEVLRSDENMFVLRTPVLANGKRLEGTYRAKEKGTRDLPGGQKNRWVLLETKVVEMD